MIRIPIRNYCTGEQHPRRFFDLLIDEEDGYRPYLEQKLGKNVCRTIAFEDVENQVHSAIREAKRRSA